MGDLVPEVGSLDEEGIAEEMERSGAVDTPINILKKGGKLRVERNGNVLIVREDTHGIADHKIAVLDTTQLPSDKTGHE